MPGTRTAPVSTPGAPRNPQGHPQERSWLNIPVVGDAPRRGRAGLRLGLGKEIPGGWDSTFPCVPRPTAGTEPGTEVRARGTGRGGMEAERSRVIHGRWHFPTAARGMWENKKRFLCCGRSAGQAGRDGAGFGNSAPAAVLLHPILSHPVLSHPTSPMGPHCRERRTLGCGVRGSPFP